MTIRLIAALVVVLAVPCGGRAQVAPAAPAPAIAPVAAQPAVAPQPAQAPQPAPAPVATPTPRLRTERAEARAQERVVAKQERIEAQTRRHIEEIEERQSKGINVRIEATVIESKGDQVTGRKTLTLTLVDGESGSVRSTQMVYSKVPTGGSRYAPSPLNMDARAFLRADGRIKVALTLDYQGTSQDEKQPPPTEVVETVVGGPMDRGIKQTVVVVLESGKPLVVAQSADAVGDRRVALEVKATVLK